LYENFKVFIIFPKPSAIKPELLIIFCK
jgi:hypothetical protein